MARVRYHAAKLIEVCTCSDEQVNGRGRGGDGAALLTAYAALNPLNRLRRGNKRDDLIHHGVQVAASKNPKPSAMVFWSFCLLGGT